MKRREEALMVEEQKKHFQKENKNRFSENKQPEFIPLSSGVSLLSSFSNTSMSSLSSSSSPLLLSSTTTSSNNSLFPHHSDVISPQLKSPHITSISSSGVNNFSTISSSHNFMSQSQTFATSSHALEYSTPLTTSFSTNIKSTHNSDNSTSKTLDLNKSSFQEFLKSPKVIPLGYSVATNAPFSLSEILRSQEEITAKMQLLKNGKLVEDENVDKRNDSGSLFIGKILPTQNSDLKLFQEYE
jgi:hypothetical protein